MDIKQKSLEKHYEWKGKIEVISRAEVKNKEQLAGFMNKVRSKPGISDVYRK